MFVQCSVPSYPKMSVSMAASPQLHTKLTLNHHKPSQSLKLKFKLKARAFTFLSPIHCIPSAAESLQLSNEENPDEENHVQEKSTAQETEENASKSSEEDGRLYVGNLSFSMTASQLSECFAEAGRVSNVEVVYDRVTDRSRGFAFVTMASVEEAKEAIRMFNGSQVGGRTVKVNFPEIPRGGERKVMGPKIRQSYQAFVDSMHKVYAGNLGWRVTSQGLKDAFAGQPGYLSARVVYEKDTGRSRGYGFVSFQSADDVQAAIRAMNGVELEGRPLRLNNATVKMPSGPSASISDSDSDSRADSAELITSA